MQEIARIYFKSSDASNIRLGFGGHIHEGERTRALTGKSGSLDEEELTMTTMSSSSIYCHSNLVPSSERAFIQELTQGLCQWRQTISYLETFGGCISERIQEIT